ncbi:(d)CMP kinase [Mycoplasmatota bacterium]|nr:(d)CMP kinase [Mycoplasmatota bacterium]
MKKFQLAIDGPAGAGKSSVSRKVAEALNINHIDTGAMYRAVTLEALKKNIDLTNESNYDFIDDINIDYRNNSIYLNGKCVDKEIRSNEIANNVSIVARQKIVRDKMVEIQRDLAEKGSVVMEGRDIGYHVLPNADLKIFLNASIEKRAERRYLEIIKSGTNVELSQLIIEIKERDKKDSTRKLNPLKKANDAVEVDTTNLTIEESIEKIIMLARKRGT